MPDAQPGTLRQNEQSEFPLRGPFGGIVSDLPSEMVERFGFDDCVNMMFRKSRVTVRPAVNTLTAMPYPPEAVVGIADFFDSAGTRHQVIVTPTRLLEWDGTTATWTSITGTLTGSAANRFTWTVVANKLLFCQGIDKVQVWDGIAASFTDVSANAVPARYLAEIGSYLVVADTIEGGNRQHQRIRWTSPGDPTDWTSFSAGQADLFNDLGPINGLVKLYQAGYAFQQLGITQIIPTGQGLRPFDFVPLAAHSKGLIAPYSLASFGENIAAYLGKDNVYVFDGTSSSPIGDYPLSGSRARVGARVRIFQDVKAGSLSTITGFVSSSINGNDFFAYWLHIPMIATWVFNFDEGNWTRFSFAKTVNTHGVFSTATTIRIKDLVGPISVQAWTPASLVATNPLDATLIGFTDGTLGLFDFTGVSEQDWYVQTGQMIMGDARHRKSVKRVRLVVDDLQADAEVTVALSNEMGYVDSNKVTFGTGSGAKLTKIVPKSVTGMYHTLKLSGSAGQLASFSEITPIFDVGGEYRD